MSDSNDRIDERPNLADQEIQYSKCCQHQSVEFASRQHGFSQSDFGKKRLMAVTVLAQHLADMDKQSREAGQQNYFF